MPKGVKSGKKRRTIVFGGAGFLGSHVADALTEAGHEVTVFDQDRSPYLRKDQKQIVGNILDADAVTQAIKNHNVVYNFAGFSDIEAAISRPLETVKANVLGNTLLLEAARIAKVQRFVFASSLYVYSKAGSFYKASKQACEAYIEAYQTTYNLPFTLLRFGSLYGPRSDRRNGIYRLLKQALERKKMIYEGDGNELREYIHVRDAALSSVDVLKPEFENRGCVLTGPSPLRVRDLLTMINEMFGNKLRIDYHYRLRPKRGATLHYRITPYSFHPIEARKLVRSSHVDLGQGLLSLLEEITQEGIASLG